MLNSLIESLMWKTFLDFFNCLLYIDGSRAVDVWVLAKVLNWVMFLMSGDLTGLCLYMRAMRIIYMIQIFMYSLFSQENCLMPGFEPQTAAVWVHEADGLPMGHRIGRQICVNQRPEDLLQTFYVTHSLLKRKWEIILQYILPQTVANMYYHYPPVSEASREEANFIKKKLPPTNCNKDLSVCLLQALTSLFSYWLNKIAWIFLRLLSQI